MSRDWNAAEQLWRTVPAIYRRPVPTAPEARPPLQEYLASFCVLLDELRATLNQLHKDSSPEASQDWLLNYLARLLDATPISPHSKGRRAEVGHAIRWRQRKGTRGTALETASVVGNVGRDGPLAGEAIGPEQALSVVVHEGWQRVAMTPRIDQPRWPDDGLGDIWARYRTIRPSGIEDRLEAAHHPNLPNATVDFRTASRALRLQGDSGSPTDGRPIPATPVSRRTDFCGEALSWEIANPHGLPCAAENTPDWRMRGGSHQDVSRRTVDLRPPDWRVGHHHPKRLPVFVERPHGFFPPGLTPLVWDDRWREADSLMPGDFTTPPGDAMESDSDGIRRKTWTVAWSDGEGFHSRADFDAARVEGPGEKLTERSIEQHCWPTDVDKPFLEIVRDKLSRTAPPEFPKGTVCTRTTRKSRRLEAVDEVCTHPGKNDKRRIAYCGRTKDALPVGVDVDLSGEVDPAQDTLCQFTNLAFLHDLSINAARVRLDRTAAAVLTVSRVGGISKADRPIVDARDCLFGELSYQAWTRLEYCTVLDQLRPVKLEASDCILTGRVSGSSGCIRFTSAPRLPEDTKLIKAVGTVISTPPLFWTEAFGEPGCAVLHPATAPPICTGAEDGGEMGAFYHRHHCRHRQAIVEKTRQFLSVGLEPVVVVDPGLCDPPPDIPATPTEWDEP